jgi:hypothetical protein
MPDYSETANLNPDGVRRFVIAAAGWGRYLEGEGDKLQSEPVEETVPENSLAPAREFREHELRRLWHSSASSYVFAAGYAGLFSPALSELLFWQASQQYLRADGRALFGGVLAACTRDRDLQEQWLRRIRENRFAPRDNVYALLILAASRESRREDMALGRDLIAGSGRWRGAHVTDLFIPASFFIDVVASAIERAGDFSFDANPLLPLLRAYADQFEFARGERTRWRTFNTRFLPISPEIAAAVIALAGESLSGPDALRRQTAAALPRIGEAMVDVALEFTRERPFPEGDRVSSAISELADRRWPFSQR